MYSGTQVVFSVTFKTPVEILDANVFVAGQTAVSVRVQNISLDVQGCEPQRLVGQEKNKTLGLKKRTNLLKTI
jgi:hypothetical protein